LIFLPDLVGVVISSKSDRFRFNGEAFGVGEPPSMVFLLKGDFFGVVNGLNLGGLKRRSRSVEQSALMALAREHKLSALLGDGDAITVFLK
jgi:hypothetical protein